MLFYVRPLETKNTEETIAAMHDIINGINCRYKTKAVFRLHSDHAQEFSGDRAKDYFRPYGIKATSTAGYDSNSNGRAENAIGLLKVRARAMLHRLGEEGRELWPLAIQHASWCLRGGTDERKLVVPAFREPVTVRIKKTPHR